MTFQGLLASFWLATISTTISAAVSVGAGTASVAAEEDVAPFSIAGMTAEAAGEAIFREADRRESGYVDLKVDLEMILRVSRGNESRRNLTIRQIEIPDDGDRLLVVFDSPKPIRGTALLSYAHKLTPDDQWIYLPAVKRVKRIASQNKSGPFLSSEFAYEDMALQELEKYSHKLLETRTDEAGVLYVVERVPTDKYSGYRRQVVVLDSEELRIQHIDYFDRQNRLLKTLDISEYAQYAGQFWKAGRMLMSNVQTGKSTELIWQNYQFATGLDAQRDFSANSLLRAR